MRFECLQENLNQGLSIVNRFISTKPQLPILANILFSATDGKLILKATNLESGVVLEVGAKIDEEGEVTVPAKTINEFIGQLPAEKIEFTTQESNLEINCQKFQATISTIPSSEFPPLPSISAKPNFVFRTDEFLSPISKVSFAAASDESRPVLSGVKILSGDKGIILAATDGFRLSTYHINSNKFPPIDLILPAKTLMDIVRILGEQKEEEFKLDITKEKNQAIFGLTKAEIICRLLEGQFPSFEKIIPTSFTTKSIINKDDFLMAIKTASIFAREAANVIKFQISPSSGSASKFQIKADATQVGKSSVELDTKTEGEGGEIAFNSRFLLEYLNIVSGEEIIFEMTNPLSPGVFRVVGDEGFTHIIMPVRINPEPSS
ncbi:MAG: DNA polymerase III subunit beta [Candidatus Gottesmanbacteria bacterium]